MIYRMGAIAVCGVLFATVVLAGRALGDEGRFADLGAQPSISACAAGAWLVPGLPATPPVARPGLPDLADRPPWPRLEPVSWAFAAILSAIMPGTGHFYIGETVAGLWHFVMDLGFLLGTFGPIFYSVHFGDSEPAEDPTDEPTTVGSVLFSLAMFGIVVHRIECFIESFFFCAKVDKKRRAWWRTRERWPKVSFYYRDRTHGRDDGREFGACVSVRF